jgi:LPS-assembly lipoprotein
MWLNRAFLAWICAAALTGGCGFHLRGSSAQTNIASAYVRGAEGVDVTSEVTNALSRSGVHLLDTPTGAAVVIDLLEEQQNTRTLSYTQRATTAESQLELAVRFKVVGAESNVLINERWARATRTYLVDTNNLVGSAQQETVLHGELISDVAQQIIRSLNAATRNAAH